MGSYDPGILRPWKKYVRFQAKQEKLVQKDSQITEAWTVFACLTGVALIVAVALLWMKF